LRVGADQCLAPAYTSLREFPSFPLVRSVHVHSAHIALSRKLLSLPLFFTSPSTKWWSALCGVRHWRASDSTGALRGRRASFAPSPWVRPREPGLSARPSRPPYVTKVKEHLFYSGYKISILGYAVIKNRPVYFRSKHGVLSL